MTSSDRIAALAAFLASPPEDSTGMDATTRPVHYRPRDIPVHQGGPRAKLWMLLECRA
ncbi:hypothetical protein [uncultured Parasphingorhabdus sp.]|uniref:hypothetical protein n=1 Tax=uncultured Parasphingorhabdus sp. TaxID=2709694 RepID=UPI002AA78852|nr:hypothetical protein [uncultured Parasphingorhabdus sp.]